MYGSVARFLVCVEVKAIDGNSHIRLHRFVDKPNAYFSRLIMDSRLVNHSHHISRHSCESRNPYRIDL